MDFLDDGTDIASAMPKPGALESPDLSARLVPAHTAGAAAEAAAGPASTAQAGGQDDLNDGTMFSSSEYSGLATATTSFKRWESQTALLEHLVNESFANGHSCKYLKFDTFGLEGDADEPKPAGGLYGLFFDPAKDPQTANSRAVTYLLNNYGGPDNAASLAVPKELYDELAVFKAKYFELLENDRDDLRFKRALLTVAFNHYGGRTEAGFMTLDEFMAMIEAHRVFTSDTMATFVFDAMDRKRKSMLTPNEFQSGMLSCSPKATQSLHSSYGKLRLQHVFRAYDLNRVGYLDNNALDLMLSHLANASRSPSFILNSADTSQQLLAMFNGKLSYDSFFYCVENDLLKDTRVLLRSNSDLADSVLAALSSTLLRVTPAESPKTPSPVPQSLAQTPAPSASPHSGPASRDLSPTRYTAQPWTREQHGYLRSDAPQPTRSSLWSHTPRVYSEFTHAKLNSNSWDPMANMNSEGAWSNTANATSKSDTPMDRLSKFYYGAEGSGGEGAAVTPSRTPTPKAAETPQHAPPLETPQTPEKLVSPFTPEDDEPPSVQSRLAELLKEYEEETEQESAGHPFTPVKDAELFEDVFESEGQLFEVEKEPSGLFTPFETESDLANLQAWLKLPEAAAPNEPKISVRDPVTHESLVLADLATYEAPKEDTVSEPVSKHSALEVPLADPSEPKAEGVPDADGFKPGALDDATLEGVTLQLSRRYKSRFLVFKGLLVDDAVANAVFKNFLAHALLGAELRWPTYSDMLQLCDSVCAILRREDSLLRLEGDVQVFASLNGDLHCLLDLFNTYGWPMVRKNCLEELARGVPVDLSSGGCVDFQCSYVFMGGFVSDLSAFSLEFVLLLFALKVMFPFHVFFLRSPKDDRHATNGAGFYDEIYRKIERGAEALRVLPDETIFLQASKELFHRINDVFEFVPVAAVLNADVLCVERLTPGFDHASLARLPKPLNLATCEHEQVYELLFKPGRADAAGGPEPAPSDLPETGFKMVVCSSDSLDSGFEYPAPGLLLLSSNFVRKAAGKAASFVELKGDAILHRSLEL